MSALDRWADGWTDGQKFHINIAPHFNMLIRDKKIYQSCYVSLAQSIGLHSS